MNENERSMEERDGDVKTVALEVSVRVEGFGQWCLKDTSQYKASCW